MDTRQSARVCVIGPAPADLVDALTIAGEPPLRFERSGATLGALAGEAVAAAPRARDVVLVHGAAPPPAGDWLGALSEAVMSPLAASAVALTAEGLPAGRLKLDAPSYPRVHASASPVMLLTRAGLALTGPPDARLSQWADVVTDMVRRIVLAGLVVVAAGDVVMPADGTATESQPWLEEVAARSELPSSRLARTRARARRALDGLSVTLDCRSLGPLRMGTQTHALGLALALGRLPDLRLRCLVAHDLDPDVRTMLCGSERATLLSYDDALKSPGMTAIVHRPEQVNTAHDLALLQPLGERLVVTHQDLIGYRNPGYHADVAAWLRHRRDTRFALQLADRVLFLSAHVRADAEAEDLVDIAWSDVVGMGVDAQHPPQPTRPDSLPPRVEHDAGFMLHLGTDLRHKNRPFALLLLKALRARGWDGALVLAGPDGLRGGTRDEEAALLGREPELAAHVHRLGAVSESDKTWLLEHAALVAYPTVDEGFGLLPFEAAVEGTPVAHAGSGALGEVIDDHEPLLVQWDPELSADRVLVVLRDPAARERVIEVVRRAAARHTWQATAERTVAAYERALRSPRPAIGWHALDRLATEAELADLRGHAAGLEAEVDVLRSFREAVGDDGAHLVGHHALLPADDRRALLAVLTRPALRGPFLAALRAGYRLGRKR